MQPLLLKPMPYITCPTLSTVSGITHAFFTRNIPQSSHVYLIKEDLTHLSRETVIENRLYAMAHLGSSHEELSLLHQIHSNEVVTVSSPLPFEPAVKADAQVTDIPGVTLGVLTADCSPVLCVDPKANVIGAAHAGWKGARSGIIANTIEAMCRLGASPANIIATIGPCIQHKSYEVGPEFKQNFLEESSDNEQWFFPSSEQAGHYFFDLPGYVLQKLKETGVEKAVSLGEDTFSNEALFFSYRRCTKRQEPYRANILSVIRINAE